MAFLLLFAALTRSVTGETLAPTNWVNDPFCPNQNYLLVGADSASPSFKLQGNQRGTLYANSLVGTPLKLAHVGDAISCSGQVTLAGDINPDGDMQFRFGLYYQGTNTTDTNWLGYTFGNPTGPGGGAATGLFVRNNPSPGVYASGSAGNAMRPPCGAYSYSQGWSAGTYDFSLAVTLLAPKTHQISWRLTGVAPNTYKYSGTYTNNFELTVPPAFDQVGFMGGAALFNSASASDSIRLKDVSVMFGKQPEPQ